MFFLQWRHHKPDSWQSIQTLLFFQLCFLPIYPPTPTVLPKTLWSKLHSSMVHHKCDPAHRSFSDILLKSHYILWLSYYLTHAFKKTTFKRLCVGSMTWSSGLKVFALQTWQAEFYPQEHQIPFPEPPNCWRRNLILQSCLNSTETPWHEHSYTHHNNNNKF